jgi:hypothetical protein
MKTESVQQPGSALASASMQRRLLTLEPLARLRAVVLLAGTVRPSQLSRSIARSLMELPLRDGRSVMNRWREETDTLASRAELEELPLKVMIDQHSRAPGVNTPGGRTRLSVERDAAAFRGTGGVLRDVCVNFEDDDVVLVANGGQILLEPLHSLTQELSAAGGDVSLLAHSDGTPVGLMLVRCGVLRQVRANGFMDFKEQVLPRLAERGDDIQVVRRARATGVALRTLDGYLAAVRAAERMSQGNAVADDPFEEDWRPTFSIVEDGAQVDASATIHDSVVLAGGTVGRDAVVVRSVVCPDGVVKAGATVADMIVARHRERLAGRRP